MSATNESSALTLAVAAEEEKRESRPAAPTRPSSTPSSIGSRFWFVFDRWLPVADHDDDFVMA